MMRNHHIDPLSPQRGERGRGGRFRAALLLGIFCLFIAFLGGCGQSETSSDSLVITNEGEFQQEVLEAQQLSEDAFKTVALGEELSASQRTNLRKAAEIFEALCSYKPTLFPTWFAVGKAYFHLGEYDKAISRLQQALLNAPPTPSPEQQQLIGEAHLFLCDSYVFQKKYQQAITESNKALALMPDHPTFLTSRASAEIQLGDFKKARKDLERALEINPSQPRAGLLLKMVQNQK